MKEQLIKVAVVEDEDDAAEHLEKMLAKYGEERNVAFNVSRHKNAITFLNNYKADYDIVFMDIDMPHMDGMSAAKNLREVDPSVILVFITNLAQMAIKGYEVSAYDFVVKPVNFYGFAMKLDKICNHIKNNAARRVLLNIGKSVIKLDVRSIIYVEVLDHQLIYHTTDGNYSSYGSLNKLETSRDFNCFFRCNSCYLVNLKHVKKVVGYTLHIGEETLAISHPRRAALVKRLNDYLGDTSYDAT